MPDRTHSSHDAMGRRSFLKLVAGAALAAAGLIMSHRLPRAPMRAASAGYGSGKYGAGKYGIFSVLYHIFLPLVQRD